MMNEIEHLSVFVGRLDIFFCEVCLFESLDHFSVDVSISYLFIGKF